MGFRKRPQSRRGRSPRSHIQSKWCRRNGRSVCWTPECRLEFSCLPDGSSEMTGKSRGRPARRARPFEEADAGHELQQALRERIRTGTLNDREDEALEDGIVELANADDEFRLRLDATIA